MLLIEILLLVAESLAEATEIAAAYLHPFNKVRLETNHRQLTPNGPERTQTKTIVGTMTTRGGAVRVSDAVETADAQEGCGDDRTNVGLPGSSE
jgi:hypothetical protein